MRNRLLVERVENLLASATSRFIETHRSERELLQPQKPNHKALACPFTATTSLPLVNEARSSFKEKLAKTGSRKLLTLDGGGIRGIISVEILAKIEAELRAVASNPDLVLSDYFDYVAGTSTGAIIATLVSLGFGVDEIRDFYVKSGAEMFQPARLWERLHTKFNDDNLTRMLKEVTGAETTLGSDKLRTLLMIVLRNATTDSAWPVSNNPKAKYNDVAVRGAGTNLHLPLWQLVRASTQRPPISHPKSSRLGLIGLSSLMAESRRITTLPSNYS